MADVPPHDFRRELRLSIRRPWVTYAAIGLNVLVFAVMAAQGAGLKRSSAVLIHWGANYAPETTNGAWWRVASAPFVHWDVVHLLINVLVLASIGPLVERMLGHWNFAIAYVLSGLLGSVTSLLWFSYVVSCGASPAIFGLYGAFLGFLLRFEDKVPRALRLAVLFGGLAFLACNLVYGAFQPNADNAANIGGFLAGVLSGIVLDPSTGRVPNVGRRPRLVRPILVCVGGVALASLGVLAAPRRLDADAELERAKGVDSATIQAYNDILIQSHEGHITETQLAAALERTILPPWRDERDRLRTIHGLAAHRQRRFDALTTYFNERYEGWALLERAVLLDDKPGMDKAEEREESAQRELVELEGKAKTTPP